MPCSLLWPPLNLLEAWPQLAQNYSACRASLRRSTGAAECAWRVTAAASPVQARGWCWLVRQAALDLFEATWEEFIGTPSRVSADDEAQVRCARGWGQERHLWPRWSAAT